MITFRRVVVATLALYIAWYLLPQVEWRWMSEDAIVLTSYAGLESSLNPAGWMHWTLFGVMIVVLCGLLFFGFKWRLLFAAYILLSTIIIVPIAGMNVETGLSMALRDLSNMLFGALLVIIFTRKKSDIDTSLQTNVGPD